MRGNSLNAMHTRNAPPSSVSGYIFLHPPHVRDVRRLTLYRWNKAPLRRNVLPAGCRDAKVSPVRARRRWMEDRDAPGMRHFAALLKTPSHFLSSIFLRDWPNTRRWNSVGRNGRKLTEIWEVPEYRWPMKDTGAVERRCFPSRRKKPLSEQYTFPYECAKLIRREDSRVRRNVCNTSHSDVRAVASLQYGGKIFRKNSVFRNNRNS